MATRRFGPIALPTEILNAQEEERLVIFAGAGVSIPEPSSLPSFEELVKTIAQDVLEKEKGEPLDRFLGRLEKNGTNIQQASTRILSKPSDPNILHQSLVGIFPNPSALRIVTTNFDRHFESSIHQRWPELPYEIYRAPALPSGDNFSGLVYLHGRLNSPARLVLTDQDFGHAYLTRGWARRFLQELFESFTVVFVGYSHEDVVMNYLARGLPPRTDINRYAIIDSSIDRQKWEYLGITPIIYELDATHSRLQTFVQDWAKQSQEGALEREVRIRQIVERPPEALDPSSGDEDYLLYSLSKPVRAQYFYRHANSVAWLEWAASHDSLNALFEHSTAIPNIGELADWFCRESLSPRGLTAARIAALRSGALNYATWATLAHRIWMGMKEHPNRTSEQSQLLALWLSILADREPSGVRWQTLAYCLKEFQLPQERDILIDLLHTLTVPRVASREGFGEAMPLHHEVYVRGDSFGLSQVVETRLFRRDRPAWFIMPSFAPLVVLPASPALRSSHWQGRSSFSSAPPP